jgi:spore coat protein U-like protein
VRAAVIAVALASWPLAAAAEVPCDVSLSLVDFGRLEGRSGGEITGRVSVRCDRPTRFALTLSEGHGSYRMRRMRGPEGRELRYNLFVDPARRLVWGDGVSEGTARLVGESDGRRSAELVVYGRVAPGQAVPPGSYADALAVAIER